MFRRSRPEYRATVALHSLAIDFDSIVEPPAHKVLAWLYRKYPVFEFLLLPLCGIDFRAEQFCTAAVARGLNLVFVLRRPLYHGRLKKAVGDYLDRYTMPGQVEYFGQRKIDDQAEAITYWVNQNQVVNFYTRYRPLYQHMSSRFAVYFESWMEPTL